MIHPHTELSFISNEIGYGVVATEFIPKGTITWVLDKLDREFSPVEISQMDGPYQEILSKYCYRNNHGNFVLCWDNGRYVNHSFNSSCLATAYNLELAIRDIQAGEELTDDYGYLNITQPFRAMDEGRRRKIVYPDDLVKYYRIWDKKLASAFKRLKNVDQPLREILDEGTWETLCRISEGKEQMESILNNYCSSGTQAGPNASGENERMQTANPGISTEELR